MSSMSSLPDEHQSDQNRPDNKKRHPPSNQKVLLRFAGMASQFLAGIGICVFIGLKADQWLDWNLPIWVWVLPLLFIISMIYGIIRNSK